MIFRTTEHTSNALRRIVLNRIIPTSGYYATRGDYFFSPIPNKLHNAFLGDLPSASDLEALDAAVVEHIRHRVFPNLYKCTTLLQSHDFGYSFVHK